MVKINRLITPYNYTPQNNKRIMWLIIHYVGAVSSAKANALYFYNNKLEGNKKASAQYFVDPEEIWQSVEDFDSAWHIGAIKYYNSARNNNSIGIEMCCKKDANGNLYIEDATIKNTVELTKYLMQKYNVPIERVARHYDCTGKICPAPFVRNESAWQNFLMQVKGANVMDEQKELTTAEKLEIIKSFYGFDDNTCNYFLYYRYGIQLIEKLYHRAKMAENS